MVFRSRFLNETRDKLVYCVRRAAHFVWSLLVFAGARVAGVYVMRGQRKSDWFPSKKASIARNKHKNSIYYSKASQTIICMCIHLAMDLKCVYRLGIPRLIFICAVRLWFNRRIYSKYGFTR